MVRRTQTYAIRLAVEGGGQVRAELISVGQSGEQSLKRIETAGERASGGLKGLSRQTELLRAGIRTLGGALIGVTTVGGLAALVDRSLSAADAIGETASKIGIGVDALQELRFAASLAGVEQQTLDMALQRFVRRVAEAANGTGEAKDALEGVALVNLLSDGSGALEQMRERARDLGIVLDEHLVRDAGRARDELDTLAQVISANLTRAAIEAAPVIADLSGWLADVAGNAGIAWERLFDAAEEKSSRTLRYELDLTSSTIEKLEGRIRELRESPTLGFTTFIDTAQINALERKLDELHRARDQTQARIAFLKGPPDTGAPAPVSAPAADDTAGVQDRAKNLARIARELEGTLFNVAHEGSAQIIAEHERRLAEIQALRAQDGSNAQQVDQLVARSAAVRDAQLTQLQAKEVEAAEKVRAANERVVVALEAERAAFMQTERERFVAQALSRLSAEATAQQRREVERLAGALFDEQQALQARQRLLDEGRSVTDRTRTATEEHAAETAKLNELLQAGTIDLATYARTVEDANDRALRSSQAWTDGATRFLKDHVAESGDAATATERAFATAFGGAEDALAGFITSGKLQVRDLADSILGDLARMTVRQTLTARSPVRCRARSPAAVCSACSTRAASRASARPRCAPPILASSSTRRGTTAAASPAPASCPTRSRSSPGAASWSCRPTGSCAGRRRRANSGRSRWWSTSPPRTRAPFVPARARSRPTWRVRSIGPAGIDERRSVPRRHGDDQGVALAIAAAAAAKLPIEIEQPDMAIYSWAACVAPSTDCARPGYLNSDVAKARAACSFRPACRRISPRSSWDGLIRGGGPDGAGIASSRVVARRIVAIASSICPREALAAASISSAWISNTGAMLAANGIGASAICRLTSCRVATASSASPEPVTAVARPRAKTAGLSASAAKAWYAPPGPACGPPFVSWGPSSFEASSHCSVSTRNVAAMVAWM
jgi:lambda family phage tail tape measure protein